MKWSSTSPFCPKMKVKICCCDVSSKSLTRPFRLLSTDLGFLSPSSLKTMSTKKRSGMKTTGGQKRSHQMKIEFALSPQHDSTHDHEEFETLTIRKR
eukprot:g19761.t1